MKQQKATSILGIITENGIFYENKKDSHFLKVDRRKSWNDNFNNWLEDIKNITKSKKIRVDMPEIIFDHTKSATRCWIVKKS